MELQKSKPRRALCIRSRQLIRYSDESTPVFRSKVLQLFRSNVRQPDRPSHYWARVILFKLNDFFLISKIFLLGRFYVRKLTVCP